MDTPVARLYKGKVTHRSWPQLPEDLVRHIATHYLLSLAFNSYCPQTWETREHWHQRMVYTMLRDAVELEKNLMSVCLGWHRALQNHLFWQQAITLIDPLDYYAPHMLPPLPKPVPISPAVGRASNNKKTSPPLRPTPWRHLRNILNHSCVVCRINAPSSNLGLGNVHHTKDRRSTMFTPRLGWVNVCREHERRKAAFCGLCLREAPLYETATAAAALGQYGYHSQTQPQVLNNLVMSVACVDNEDEDTWPNVEATCRTCRSEWLWRKASGSERDCEAIVGSAAMKTISNAQASTDTIPINMWSFLLCSEDWETRQTVECFLDLGEGTISDILCLAREKWWLRKFTKLGDMMMQALAARRWNLNPGSLSGRTSPVRAISSREQQQVIALEEAATATSTTGTRTLSSGVSDVASEADGHFESDATLDTQRRPILREVQDDFESVADDEESLEDEDEEDEEDTGVLQTQENSVRELALGDWARARILDGYWISPADSWYNLETGYPPPPAKWQKDQAPHIHGQHNEAKKGDTWTYAVHPCPWTIEKEVEESSREAGSSSSAIEGTDNGSEHPDEEEKRVDEHEESHPHWKTVVSDIPPTYSLCEQAYQSHQKQIMSILLPAMKNIVRKIVMECGAAAGISSSNSKYRARKRRRVDDPVMIVNQMTLEDVVKILREEEAVWFDGVDWMERMKNEDVDGGPGMTRKRQRHYHAEERVERASPEVARNDAEHVGSTVDHESGLPPSKKRRTSRSPSFSASPRIDDDATAASASSGSGSGTSPVLSTTTLATTPSPPMLDSKVLLIEDGAHKEDSVEAVDDDEVEKKIMIPVSPILDQPKQLRPIPYVPLSISRFPTYTMDALRLVWREACAPLYHCRCRICERAALAHAAANSRSHGHYAGVEDRRAQVQIPQSPQIQRQNPVPEIPREVVGLLNAYDGTVAPRQKFEHEGEILELQEVDLNELEFDQDEVVEIDFRNEDGDGVRKELTGGIEDAAYCFPRERDRHRNPDTQRKERRKAVTATDENARPGCDTLTDEELRSFGLTRDEFEKGNVNVDSSGEDDNLVLSPLPSDDVGDTTSHADSVDSGQSSRKRSCDELEVDPSDDRAIGYITGSPKRAKLDIILDSPRTPLSRSLSVGPRRSPTPARKVNRGDVDGSELSEDRHMAPVIRKRSSEDMGGGAEPGPVEPEGGRPKKARMSVSDTPDVRGPE